MPGLLAIEVDRWRRHIPAKVSLEVDMWQKRWIVDGLGQVEFAGLLKCLRWGRVGGEVSWSEMKGEVWAESCTLPTTLARWYLQSGHGRESRERRERLWTEP